MNLHFRCSSCDAPGSLELPNDPKTPPPLWSCPQCDHLVRPAVLPSAGAGKTACGLCGNAELYRKKDFPHSLGMAILVAGCVTSTIAYGLHQQWLTWSLLLGTAFLDGVLYYAWVKDVVVCYRCWTHHRRIPGGTSTLPLFELVVHERYRQERLRHEEILKS